MTESVRKLQINLYDDHRKMNPNSENGIYMGHEPATLPDVQAWLSAHNLVAVPVEVAESSSLDFKLAELMDCCIYPDKEGVTKVWDSLIAAAQEQGDG